MITVQKAVMSLRPGAEWSMNGDDVEGIIWHTKGVEPLTTAEVQAEVKRLEKAEAQAVAREILATAEEKAASLVRDAETKAADALKQSREQLAELRTERDAIAEYIESLRAVVGDMTKKAPKKR